MKYPDWILERAFGGLDTAVSPLSGAQPGRWPEGPSAPMARDACAVLEQACLAPTTNGSRQLVFLVGGAGNGKSKLTADTVRAVGGVLAKPRGAFAQRSYRFGLPAGGSLSVVNDATIPPEEPMSAPLASDIAGAIERGEHLLACVNRGVLISEHRSIAGTETGAEGLAAAVITWLLTGEAQARSTESTRLEVKQASSGASGYYGFAKLWLAGHFHAGVHVVYLDQASLLESWDETAQATPPADQPLQTRDVRMTPILSPERHLKSSAFERCVVEASTRYLSNLPNGPLDALDPVRANATSLSRAAAARGWCSTMRGAEIASGIHFSYRELWALWSHGTVGPVTGDALARLYGWIGTRQQQARDGGPNRLAALQALGQLRTHMLLFDAGRATTGQGGFAANAFSWADTNSEALRAVQAVDPLRQFGPIEGHAAAALAEALSGIEEGRLPLADLANEDAAIAAYWTPLDAEIEKAICASVDPGQSEAKMSDRNGVLSWYGHYAYRLAALARGWPAHVSIINTWQNAWLDADQRGTLSRGLEGAILDIIVPRDEEGRTYLAFLQPRVSEGNRGAAQVRIEVNRNRVDVLAQTKGDRVDLLVNLGRGQQPAVASLDFHLLREAIAKRDGQGFTDSLALIEPRIERIRASIVAARMQDEMGNRYMFSDRNFSVVV